MTTIATHNGSAAHRDHNIRNEKVVSKEKHIDPKGHYEIWKDEKPREAYHKLFDRAVERYNAKQTREDRKIDDYYMKIAKDKKKHPVYEMIIGVYPSKEKNIGEEKQRAILKEFVDDWQVRNPNLYMCGAYYHADEEGEPHVHIDYIPVARGYTKGMDTQTGLVKALEGQGFVKQGKATAQIQWERSENEYLERLCRARGIKIEHPKEEGRIHLDTERYKAEQRLKSLQSEIDESKSIKEMNDSIVESLDKEIEDRERNIGDLERYIGDLEVRAKEAEKRLKMTQMMQEDIFNSLTSKISEIRAELSDIRDMTEEKYIATKEREKKLEESIAQVEQLISKMPQVHFGRSRREVKEMEDTEEEYEIW